MADTSSLSVIKTSEIQALLHNLLGTLREQLNKSGKEDKTILENYISEIELFLDRIEGSESEALAPFGSSKMPSFPPVMYKVVDHLATKMHISREDVVNRAITLLNVASYASSTGQKVGIVGKNQQLEIEIKGF